ncbi:toll/interleukin-1 receptor domain-containing protein [Fulvivirgaceae bacterium BMA10]|uniref:Toll/interleukin-1 receptor domain-containing protein n=1 Tax=Splendidivirga corallicola TaxID=3051826 RepID=A0ABT8KKF9_9BACT|nr:toll/interleukin-1 receptor domain-containing protein [Fulvivirgaceae bacterium BMA10]
MIITRAELRGYRNRTRNISKGLQDSLNEWVNESKTGKITVFLSHKHEELEELDGVISLLKVLGVEVYVDWQDTEIPKNTNGATARIIKRKIRENKKFILLATEAAIASKWCNWELGYGDAMKFKDHIAIFPVRNTYEQEFSGSEYLAIYPSIEYRDGTTKRVSGQNIPKGYYVFEPPNAEGNRALQTLKNWLTS